MQRRPGSGGREKRTGSGGKNAYRRGEGLGGGPVGRKPSGAGRGAERAGGSGGNMGGLLLGLGAAAAANAAKNAKKGRKKKGGFNLKTLLIILVLLVLAYMLFKQCSAEEAAYENNFSNATIESAFGGGLGESAAPAQTADGAGADYTVSNLAREKYTTIRGNGRDVFTIMVYMCGTDLESQYGMATSDLNEMLHSELGENVNIIIETGGTKKWKNSVISNSVNQIYQVKNGEFLRLEKDIGSRAMTDPDTLSDFIRYCTKNFPADRYGLIFWDHGGGSLSGYGYDEKYPNTAMTLDKIDKALAEGGAKFDFIGFDACLMATYETAVVTERYADYLIASEETEPGCGWYYTNWLTKLSANSSMPTVEIGKNIIDDFISRSAREAAGSATTLSIIDLAQLSGTVPEAFNAFAKDAIALLDAKEYERISDARSDAREFAESSNINQIDLIDLCDKIGTDAAEELAAALRGCIKYNRHSSGMARSNGVSIYFPYGKLSSVNNALSLYDDIDMDESYTDCIRSFASLAAGGQIASGSSSSPLSTLMGGSSSAYGDLLASLMGAGGGGQSAASYSSSDILTSVLGSYLSGSMGSSAPSSSASGDLLSTLLGAGGSYANSSTSYGGGYGSLLGALLSGDRAATGWMDTERMLRSADYYDEKRIDQSLLVPSEKDDAYVLHLPDEQWELVQNIALNVFLDDGEGYIDLGMDNTYTWDEELDLVMDYDHTWISLNGQIVSYYFLDETRSDDGSYEINGRVPALLNGERVELMLQFTDANPYGSVLGAKRIYDAEETEQLAKGLIPLESGDTLDFLCDYYDYEGAYRDSYMLGEPLVVDGEIEIYNVDVGEAPCLVSYCLSDLYNNRYWTEALEQ